MFVMEIIMTGVAVHLTVPVTLEKETVMRTLTVHQVYSVVRITVGTSILHLNSGLTVAMDQVRELPLM